MSIPASRLSDSTICPTHGLPGFVVGPSAQEMLIGGFKAACYTDSCACSALHTSPLAEGAAMVLINGLPAARVGAKTLDGGELVQGDASVLIGGDSFAIPSFISIEGGAEYQAKVLRDLHKIASTPSGEKLLASLAAGGHKLRIHDAEALDEHGKKIKTSTDPENSDANATDPTDPRASDGTGVAAHIGYDPDKKCIPYNKEATWAYPPNYSPDTELFHEMVHADDMSHGRFDKTPCWNTGRNQYDRTRECELRAVGAGSYADESEYPYSENTYRKDRGYENRDFY